MHTIVHERWLDVSDLGGEWRAPRPRVEVVSPVVTIPADDRWIVGVRHPRPDGALDEARRVLELGHAAIATVEVRPIVFLSSTSELREYPEKRSYVAAAEAAVVSARCLPRHMAQLTASDEAPADYCRRAVGQTDVYVGIIGFRWGSQVPGLGMSYTELEFDTATRLGLPRLIFMLDAHKPHDIPVDQLMDVRQGRKQERFRQRLEREPLIVVKVADPADLEHKLFKSLIELPVVRPGAPPPPGSAPITHRRASATLPRPATWFTDRPGTVDLTIPMVTRPTEAWLRAGTSGQQAPAAVGRRLHRPPLQAGRTETLWR